MSVPPDTPPGLGLAGGAGVASAPVGSDAALLEALRQGDTRAKGLLFDRYAGHVERVLRRVLGLDPDLADVLQDVFVEALTSIQDVRDPNALRSWLSSIAVFTARRKIRSRVRRRWLMFLAPDAVPEPPSEPPRREDTEALRRTYAVLDRMPTDERIAFALRYVDGMELTEVARACDVSLATIKRRLVKAEQRFVAMARRDPVLEDWVKEGRRWAT